MGRHSFNNLIGDLDDDDNFDLDELCQISSGRREDSTMSPSRKLSDADQQALNGFLNHCTIRPVQRYMLMKSHIEQCPFYERWKEHAHVWATRKTVNPLGPGSYDISGSYVTRPRSPQWHVSGKDPPKEPPCEESPIYDIRGMTRRGGVAQSRSTALHSRLVNRPPTPTPAPNAYDAEDVRRKPSFSKAPEWCEICMALKCVLKAGGWSSVKSFLQKLNTSDVKLDKFANTYLSYCENPKSKYHLRTDGHVNKKSHHKKVSNSSSSTSRLEENLVQYFSSKYSHLRDSPTDDAPRCKLIQTTSTNNNNNNSTTNKNVKRVANKSQRNQTYRCSKVSKNSTNSRKSPTRFDDEYENDRYLKHYQRPTQCSLNKQQQRIIGSTSITATPKRKSKKPGKENKRKSTKAMRVPSRCDLISCDDDNGVGSEKKFVNKPEDGSSPTRLVEVNGQFLEISPTDLYRNQLYNVGCNVKYQVSSIDVRNRVVQGDSRAPPGKVRYDLTSDVSYPKTTRFRPVGTSNVYSECSIVQRSTTRRLR